MIATHDNALISALQRKQPMHCFTEPILPL